MTLILVVYHVVQENIYRQTEHSLVNVFKIRVRVRKGIQVEILLLKLLEQLLH